MKKKIYIKRVYFIVLIICIYSWNGQAQIEVGLPNNEMLCSSDIVIPIKISRLTNVHSISLTFTFDENLVNYNGYDNLNSKLENALWSVNATGNTVNFELTLPVPVTLYNSALIEILFTSAADNVYCLLNFDTITPGACQFISFNNDTLTADYIFGSMYLSASSCGKINGNISYKNNDHTPLSYSEVLLKHNWGEIYKRTTSDSNGHFTFRNLNQGQYIIDYVGNQPWGGENGADALMIMKYFVGLYTLQGINRKAADVNGSGTVGSEDALMSVRRFVSIIDHFPVGDWVHQPVSITISDSSAHEITLNALCYGDVDGSYSATFCTPWPTAADAGPDQSIMTSSTCLQGNTPLVGTGIWSIVFGSGGAIVEPYNPNSMFIGVPGQSYGLKWTISNLCNSISDLVKIDVHTANVPCPGLASFSYGGQIYHTVQIGLQCWMKENLNIGSKISANVEQSNNGVIEKYCYNNDSALCSVYGGLYKWDEMMQYVTDTAAQGICPAGFHIPTDNDWKILENILGTTTAVGKLKETGTLHWYTPNYGATNVTGFTALGAGIRNPYTLGFAALKFYGEFWTSTLYSTSAAWYRLMSYDAAFVYREPGPVGFAGLSIRCVKSL